MAYDIYFYGNVTKLINTDTLSDQVQWQSDGVDHIVQTKYGKQYYIDFMLRETPYNDFFLEIEVEGKPGKFQRFDLLTDLIAYSYRPKTEVYIFDHKRTCELIQQNLSAWKKQFRVKQSISVKPDGSKWSTTGLIIPIQTLEEILTPRHFTEIRLNANHTTTVSRRNSQPNHAVHNDASTHQSPNRNW